MIMDQMSICNVKGVTHSYEPSRNYHQTVAPLSSEHFSVFQLIILVFRRVILWVWFSLIASNLI